MYEEQNYAKVVAAIEDVGRVLEEQAVKMIRSAVAGLSDAVTEIMLRPDRREGERRNG